MHRLFRHLQATLDVYSVRFSIGLIASLLFVIGLTQLPLQERPGHVGWDTQRASERIQISDFRLEEAEDDVPQVDQEAPSTAPVTVQEQPGTSPEDEPPPAPGETPAAMTEPDPGAGDDATSSERDAVQLAALGPSGQVPQIIGGRGSLYLRINYPEEARRQGIEGRVVLDFIVDTDGVTHDIRILNSLHPLCDSAAVDALRETRFVPAKRNGEKVPVRMRLPIRFQIINYATTEPDPSSEE